MEGELRSMEEGKKLSVAECKRILEADGASYTEDQVIKIREALYILGELDYLIFMDMRNKEKCGPDNPTVDKAA